MNGRIKIYKDDKGFGFIKGEDGQDYFFHISQVINDIPPKIGLKTNFSPDKNDKGLTAVKINIIEHSKKIIKIGNNRINVSNIKQYGSGDDVKYMQQVYNRKWVKDGSTKIKRFIGIGSYKDFPTDLWKEIDEKRYKDIVENRKKYSHIYTFCPGDYIGEYKNTMDNYIRLEADRVEIIDMNTHYFDVDTTQGRMKFSSTTYVKPSDVKKEKTKYLYITTIDGDNFKFILPEAELNKRLNQIDEIMM